MRNGQIGAAGLASRQPAAGARGVQCSEVGMKCRHAMDVKPVQTPLLRRKASGGGCGAGVGGPQQAVGGTAQVVRDPDQRAVHRCLQPAQAVAAGRGRAAAADLEGGALVQRACKAGLVQARLQRGRRGCRRAAGTHAGEVMARQGQRARCASACPLTPRTAQRQLPNSPWRSRRRHPQSPRGARRARRRTCRTSLQGRKAGRQAVRQGAASCRLWWMHAPGAVQEGCCQRRTR